MFKKITLLLTALCLISIFELSAQPATTSAAFSMKVALAGVSMGERLGWIEEGTHEDAAQMNGADNRLRQSAHSVVFFALSVVLTLALLAFGLRLSVSLGLTLMMGVLLAILDEYHQMFVPGRGMEMQDFISDFQGIVLGLLVVGGLRSLKRLAEE